VIAYRYTLPGTDDLPKDTWNFSELATRLGLSDTALLRPAAESWAVRGVLKALGNNTYQLLERSEDEASTIRRPILNLQG
jgi:hypothetical protein